MCGCRDYRADVVACQSSATQEPSDSTLPVLKSHPRPHSSTSEFQEQKKEGKGKDMPQLSFNFSWKLPHTLILVSHWPQLNHMPTPNSGDIENVVFIPGDLIPS